MVVIWVILKIKNQSIIFFDIRVIVFSKKINVVICKLKRESLIMILLVLVDLSLENFKNLAYYRF